ncbi:Arc family DNA-binding protein [Paracoccus onubensis]|uniref:Arc family DNA-binding protein n=1 Tax=Paracoccus onubensis TaxID=1675788 RepID=A0A418SRV2_9RHOB|nr:Arc family DNA-binding protein [Paracoccus onubensis]
MCENVLMAKQAALSFRIPDEMKTALEKAATDDDRSVSSLVMIILRDWLKEHGHQDGT